MISRGMRYGISRGVFSNEAGLGTLAILHGAADRADPKQQGMWAMFEVFFDTVILCTLTGLVILCVAGTEPGANPYQGRLWQRGVSKGVWGRQGSIWSALPW